MKEAIIAMAMSPVALGVYGTLVTTGLVYAGNKYLGKKKARKAYNVALTVAHEVEDSTAEDTRVDNFLDKAIKRLEQEIGRTPNKKEVEAIKEVKKQVDKGKQ